MDPATQRLHVEWQIDRATAAAFFAQVSETWRRLGKERPHWSVLAHDRFLPENMPGEVEAFYETGDHDAHLILDTLARLGRTPGEFPVFFEFGCGLGRATSRICRQFERVVGCDISAVHLGIARDVLRQQGAVNVELKEANATDFGMSDPFDLWYSGLVLQHNPPPLIAMIIERALTMLRPRGLAIFQVPVYRPGYAFKVRQYRRSARDTGAFEMHLLPQSAILQIARQAGCAPLEIRDNRSAGEPWVCNLFTFEKQGPSRGLPLASSRLEWLLQRLLRGFAGP
jgi:SAM-dependent methyltransferase